MTDPTRVAPPAAPPTSAADLAHIQRRIDSNPFSHQLQLRVVRAWPDGAELEMPIRPEVMQMLGLVHGGALATLVDSACASALWPRLEKQGDTAVTLEMKLNFLASPKGKWVRAIAEVLRFGRSTAYLEAGIRDEQDKLCLRASATFFILHKETPA